MSSDDNERSENNENSVKDSLLELIVNEIGGFGRFQIQNPLLICFAMFCIGVCGISYVFAAGDLNYRCFVPTCENESVTEYNPTWLEYAVPFSNDEPEQCEQYKNVNDACEESSFDKSVIEKCSNFVYETNEKTIVNEWNLTCQENKWRLALVGTLASLGIFFGTPFVGFFSDKYGRRIVFTFGMVACGMCGIIKSFSRNYITYLVFEFLDPFFGAGVYSGAFILGIEFFGPKYRLMCGTITSSLYSLGAVVMGFAAMMTQDWRLFLKVIYAPTFLFLSYHWLVPDSVRWLHSANRTEDVVKLLNKAAATNKVILSKEAVHSLETYRTMGHVSLNATTASSVSLVNSSSKNEYKLLDIFKFPKILIRLSICAFVWMANTFVYYGLSLHAVSIGGNKYSSFMLVSLIEIPGYFFCWFFGEKIGRRVTLSGSLLLSGLSCLLAPLLENIFWLKLIFYLIGKFAITISFSTIYVYTTEMFPTNLRHSLFAISATFGKIGGMIAPQTPLLKVVFKSFPMILFGSVAIASGLLSLIFPETLNKELPDTLEQANDLGKKHNTS